MQVLLIGATGVIGREVLKVLLREKHSVTTFNRRELPEKYDVVSLQGDCRSIKELHRAFEDRHYDAVIDLACYTEQDAALLMEASRGKTDQLVICSSVAAYKRPYSYQPVKEDNPLMDVNTFDYGFQKAQMERYLQKKIANGLPITIIRPSQTYGVGTPNLGCLRNNYGLLARMKEKKPILVNGDGRNPWVWSFAPDIAKAFSGVLGKDICLGESYHVTSDEPHIWDDLYLTIGDIIGEKPTLYHMPTDMLYQAKPQWFAHLVYEKTYCGLFDNSKFKAAVPGFSCEYSLRSGLEMICDWLIHDETQHVSDPEKVLFEDQACALYEKWVDEMRRLRES